MLTNTNLSVIGVTSRMCAYITNFTKKNFFGRDFIISYMFLKV